MSGFFWSFWRSSDEENPHSACSVMRCRVTDHGDAHGTDACMSFEGSVEMRIFLWGFMMRVEESLSVLS